MKKARWKKILKALLAMALCLTFSCTGALAAATGSLRITLTDDRDLPVEGVTISLYRVGREDGTLSGKFSGAGISPDSLLSERDNAVNGKTLADWVKDHGITGTELTTDSAGQVFYDHLATGVYLVLCGAGQDVTFTPFLARIPTVVDGTARYDVHSTPKAEKVTGPDGPGTDPGGPGTDPDDPGTGPDLPHTGTDPLPMYTLLILGVLLVVLGAVDLWRNRRERDE